MKRAIVVFALLTLVAGVVSVAVAQDDCRRKTTFTETFSGGSNVGDWTFGIFQEPVIDVGGSHGEAMVTTCTSNPCSIPDRPLATFAPRARTQGANSEFVGNLRAKGVTQVSADFRLYDVSFTSAERPMSLVLVDFNGTPKDPTDDRFVFSVGKKNIPSPSPTGNGGWQRYTFDLPTASETLPTPRSEVEWDPGWGAGDKGEIIFPAADPDAVWNRVVENVDQMIFWFHDPRLFAIIQDWKVGMDNPSITFCAN